MSARNVINFLIVGILVVFTAMCFITPTTMVLRNGKIINTNLFDKYTMELLYLQCIAVMVLFLVNIFTKREIINGHVVENTSPVLQYVFLAVIFLAGLSGIGWMVQTLDIMKTTQMFLGVGFILLFIFTLISDRERQRAGKDSILINELVATPLKNINIVIGSGVHLLDSTVRGVTGLTKAGYLFMSSDHGKKEKVVNPNQRYERPTERYESKQERYEKPAERYESRHEIPIDRINTRLVYDKIVEYLQHHRIKEVDESVLENIASDLGLSVRNIKLIIEKHKGS